MDKRAILVVTLMAAVGAAMVGWAEYVPGSQPITAGLGGALIGSAIANFIFMLAHR